MRPTIAISAIPRSVTTGYGLDTADTVVGVMVKGVLAAGAAPLVLPVTDPEITLDQIRAVDGIILAGGRDIAPEDATDSADWRRDRYELALWRQAWALGIPVLGICRGLQLVNVALGGTLKPHVEGHDAGPEHASLHHRVHIEPDSRLGQILGGNQDVNTLHHQSIEEVGTRLRVVARALDGCIEAAELPSDDGWFIGVQWHPELMLAQPGGQALFDALLAAAVGGCNRGPWSPSQAQRSKCLRDQGSLDKGLGTLRKSASERGDPGRASHRS
jgi:putative glutamine amidotransferase